jgi:hypothetical protein
MGAAGRIRAREVFSLETEARETRAVYDAVAGSRRLPGSGGSQEAGS